MNITCGLSPFIHILRSNLPVFGKAEYQLIACDKSALAVGDRHDDTFDDQYITEYSGEWFKPINVGREKDGGDKYGGLWGAQSILTDFKEYMKDGGDGEQRINYTAETYKLKKANLIDVLGLCPIRYSFNP